MLRRRSGSAAARGSRLTIRVVRLIVLLVVVVTGGLTLAASVHAQQPPRAAQDEFVPIDQLPPDEKLPAAPLLIAAYSVAWILVAAYLWSIWRRLGQVEREMADVERRLQQSSAIGDAKTVGGRKDR